MCALRMVRENTKNYMTCWSVEVDVELIIIPIVKIL